MSSRIMFVKKVLVVNVPSFASCLLKTWNRFVEIFPRLFHQIVLFAIFLELERFIEKLFHECEIIMRCVVYFFNWRAVWFQRVGFG